MFDIDILLPCCRMFVLLSANQKNIHQIHFSQHTSQSAQITCHDKSISAIHQCLTEMQALPSASRLRSLAKTHLFPIHTIVLSLKMIFISLYNSSSWCALTLGKVLTLWKPFLSSFKPPSDHLCLLLIMAPYGRLTRNQSHVVALSKRGRISHF